MVFARYGFEITLSDYFTVYYTIIVLFSRMAETDFKDAKRVKEAMYLLANDEASNELACRRMWNTLLTFGYLWADITKTHIWYKHNVEVPKQNLETIQNIIEIHSMAPQTISVVVDRISRPAVRAGWATDNVSFTWLKLKASNLNIKGPFADIPLDVYIQSHAILRLAERIDCFVTGMLHFNLYSSLANPKICYDTHNNLLIEYVFLDTKLGYLRADIVDGIILIRTFLFITNNSTPEGQLLEKNTGLQKLDKKYLSLDKLSTFMTSDIGNNKEVCKILVSAGCECLVHLHQKMHPLLTKKDNKFDTDYMLHYVNGKATTQTCSELV